MALVALAVGPVASARGEMAEVEVAEGQAASEFLRGCGPKAVLRHLYPAPLGQLHFINISSSAYVRNCEPACSVCGLRLPEEEPGPGQGWCWDPTQEYGVQFLRPLAPPTLEDLVAGIAH